MSAPWSTMRGLLPPSSRTTGGQVACGRLHNDAPQFGASGEEDQVPAFAEQERIDIAVALYDGDILLVVDLGDHPCKGVGHVRGVGRGLEHGGTSGRNGPHQGVEQQLHGVVPRGDDECRAERFGEDAARRGLQLERRRPVLGTHPASEVAQVVAHLAPHDAQLGEVGLLGRFVQVQPQRLAQRPPPTARAPAPGGGASCGGNRPGGWLPCGNRRSGPRGLRRCGLRRCFRGSWRFGLLIGCVVGGCVVR